MFAFGNGGPLNLPTIMKNATAFWGFDDASLATTVFDSTGRGNNLTRTMLPAVSTLTFTLSGNCAGTPDQLVTGRMAKWGKWNRILTSAELTALNTGIGWPFTGGNASLSDAAAYYLLDEAAASSTYADATGRGNTLTKSLGNATGSAAGPLGTDAAVVFDGTNQLSRAITSVLQTRNTAFTIAGWVYMTALGTTQQMFWGQFDGNVRTGTVVYYHHGNGAFQMDHGNDVDLYRNAGTVSTGLTPLVNTWYFVVSQYDPVTNQTTQIINNSLSNSLASIQQPIEVAGKPPGTAGHFRVNPDYRANTPNTSGWDLVGSAVNCTIPQNADVSFGNNAKTVWGWVKFDDFTTSATVMGLYQQHLSAIDWVIQIGAGVFYFITGDNAGHFDLVTVPLADNNWHLFVAWFDKSGDGKIHLNLDNGAQVATPVTPTHTPATGSQPFIIGAAGNNTLGSGYNQQFAGAVDAVGIANGVPSAGDIAALWNNGNGRNL